MGGEALNASFFCSFSLFPSFDGKWFQHYKTRIPGYEVTHTPTAVIYYKNGVPTVYEDGLELLGINGEKFDSSIFLMVKCPREFFEQELNRYNLIVPSDPPRPRVAPPPLYHMLPEDHKDD